jgi:amidase
MSEIPIVDWQGLAASKREDNLKKIPEKWRLPESLTSKFIETSTISVIDVPATCGLLTPRELELTSDYDASKYDSKHSHLLSDPFYSSNFEQLH